MTTAEKNSNEDILRMPIETPRDTVSNVGHSDDLAEDLSRLQKDEREDRDQRDQQQRLAKLRRISRFD